MSPVKKYFCVFLLFVPVFGAAQRLPEGIAPAHYDLTFTPDLDKAVFSGEETIQVQVVKPSKTITLNAVDLAFETAEISQAGKTQTAQVGLAAEKEQATLTPVSPLEAGPATIHIKFTGTLNDKLRGFYLASSPLRKYATTQFEATDARRAFPSFDEPALKATFDISLIVNQGDTAISNGRIISDTPGPGEGKHTIKFSTTAKMSTYLVAMAAGDFTCNEGSADNIPIRVCGTPDKKPLGTAALRYAEEILQFYNRYYGIPYPFGKLDILGVPDFEAGAMENTGAIFYRESVLFIDDKNSSVRNHQTVFEILAHEMAHQWFGDLVTMQWWDNVWLNEGFATWMALKPSQSLHPEWNANLDAVNETNQALAFDALRNTHAIRSRADTPAQINEMFDPISYEKGAAVLRMLEAYVTPEVFRRGVNAYLRKFAYGNATAEDFWRALAAASGRPVEKIMPTFVEQPGEPLITVQAACVAPPPEPKVRRRKRSRWRPVRPAEPKTQISLGQARLLDDPTAVPPATTWMVPVCVKTETAKPFCQILSQKQQTVPAVGCSPWVFVNAGASGYYRTRYDKALLEGLHNVLTTELSTAERLSLLNDEAALVRSGHESAATYLDLVAALNQDAERAVVESYGPILGWIHGYLLTEANKPAFQNWVRSNFSPMFAKIGWTPAANETDDQRRLRAVLVEIMGAIGEDPETIRHAVELAKQYVKDPHALDPSLAPAVLDVAGRSNDAELFDLVMAALGNQANTPEQTENLAGTLGAFSDERLVGRWLQKAVAPETRNQDTVLYLGRTLYNMRAQKTAWEWTKQHWPEVESKLTTSSGAMLVGATRSFCDREMRDDVQQFFTQHKVAAAERTLKQSLESIDTCIKNRSKLSQDVTSWLQQRTPNAAGGDR